VIHRDIKPENILLHDGQALIADFGIALAVSHAGGSRLTETGLSIGTPHYMSPEQAMGDRELDARSDVYSLGAMLYEMLAGDPPYTGSTAQAIVAKVITEKAPLVTTARDTVPPHVAAAIAKALAKLPADRFRSAADFGEALGGAGFSMPATGLAAADRARVRTGSGLWNPLSLAASALAAILLIVTAWLIAQPRGAMPLVRFQIMLDSTQPFFFTGQSNPPRVGLSPNGTEMVYVAVASGTGAVSVGNLGSGILGTGSSGRTSGTVNVLMHRRFHELQARQLPGTEGAWAPRFAPDGERVAFVTTERGRMAVKVVSLAGGPPVTVLDSGVGSTVAWGPGDHLYFLGQAEPAVYRVSAGGGPPELVTTLQTTSGVRYAWPSVLPGGKGIILSAIPEGSAQSLSAAPAIARAGLEVQVFDLSSGEARVSVAGAFGTYSPTGHLVYVTPDRTLLAARFDASSLTLRGRPTALIEGLDVRNDGISDLALSPGGTLAYTTRSSNAPERVSWITRTGDATPVDPAWTRDWEFEGLALSPDGRRAAVVIEDAARGDVWIKQLDRGPLSRLTFGGEYNGSPTWSADGRTVTFISFRRGNGDVWMKPADGSGSDSLVLDLEQNVYYAEWSRDAEWLVVSVEGTRGGDDVFVLQAGADSARPILADPFNEFHPALSPDGQWLAYVSDESGRAEVYVRPFPAMTGGKWQLSTLGGIEPIWSATGRELYFRSLDGSEILAVDLSRGPAATSSRTLTRLPAEDDFERNPRNRLFSVSPDGRFLMIQRAGATDVSGDLVVVLNWFEELEAKVGR
jgi:serine/threonine-protein kinase